MNATVGGVVEQDRQMSITDHANTLSVRVRPSAFSFRLGAIRSNPFALALFGNPTVHAIQSILK